MSPVEDLTLLDFDRSNKGASKQRRDQINAEIATMRDLLPLPESSRQRLSQLQIMSLTCVYIRKCNVLHKLFRARPLETHLPDSLDFFQALTGFLLVTTREGKLLYISENVTDFLGHSMVDMKTQGDSLFDIVDKRDHATVRNQLLQCSSMEDKNSLSDISFFCRMNMSRTLKRQSGFGDVKVMHVRGHFIGTGPPEPGCPIDSQCIFMATCSPLITPDLKENLVQNNTMVFKTVHHLDMSYYEVTKTAEYHLGMSTDELYKKSWYSMLYPEDIHEAKEKHMQLIRSNHEMGCMMTVRMLKADGSIFWVNLVMHVRQATLTQNDEPLIVCINQVIDAQEALQIKGQGHMPPMFPNRSHEIWGSQFQSILQAGQEPSSGHWMQKVCPVAMPSYPTNIPSYIGQPVHSSMYAANMSVLNTTRMDQPSQEMTNIMAPSLDQSDQLKARLKRKIQGPHTNTCKPNKMPRGSWAVDRNGGGHGFSDMDQNFSLMEHYTQAPMTEGSSDCSGQQMLTVQPRYRIGEIMTAKSSPKFFSCPGMALPMSGMFTSEQVVPDVNVPESYLTPDPSPVSSPEPSCVAVKTEVMDSEVRQEPSRTSQDILKALEKLAAQPQELRLNSVPAEMPMAPLAKPARKELPVFDAFDIDNFFDALKTPEDESKTSPKMEALPLKKEIKMELPEETMSAENIPNFATLKEEKQCMSPPYFVPVSAVSHVLPQPTVHSMSLSSDISETYFEPPIHLSFTPNVPSHEASMSVAARSNKDMIVLPQPRFSSQEKIDDLLSYFSDDGSDISSLQTDPGSFYLDHSATDDLLGENFYQKPFHVDHFGSYQKQMGHQLSPLSSRGSLSGEEDLVLEDDPSTDMLEARHGEDLTSTSFKEQDVLSMHDEFRLDFSDFFPSSEGSLDLIKNGQ